MKIHNYHVCPAGQDQSFTFLGGPAIRDGKYLWLTGPGGERIMRVLRSEVREITREQLASLIVEDAKHRQAERN